jgi:hypothetical protein
MKGVLVVGRISASGVPVGNPVTGDLDGRVKTSGASETPVEAAVGWVVIGVSTIGGKLGDSSKGLDIGAAVVVKVGIDSAGNGESIFGASVDSELSGTGADETGPLTSVGLALTAVGAAVPCSCTGGVYIPDELEEGALRNSVGLGDTFGTVIESGVGTIGDDDLFLEKTGTLDGGRRTESVGLIVGANGSVTTVTFETTFPVGSYVVLSTDPHSFNGSLNMEQNGSAISFATVQRNLSSKAPCLQPSSTISSALVTRNRSLLFGCIVPIIGNRPNIPLNNRCVMALVSFSSWNSGSFSGQPLHVTWQVKSQLKCSPSVYRTSQQPASLSQGMVQCETCR